MDNCVFYYINGEPLNGKWIDLYNIDSIDDVLESLAEDDIIPRDDEGDPNYDGDLLVADVEGDLAREFYQGDGCFDLDGFIEVRDSDIDEPIAAAFISLFDTWDERRCDETYLGQYSSDEDYAREFIDQCGLLSEVPRNLRCYFDYERYANDLMINDVCEYNGYYFNNW